MSPKECSSQNPEANPNTISKQQGGDRTHTLPLRKPVWHLVRHSPTPNHVLSSGRKPFLPESKFLPTWGCNQQMSRHYPLAKEDRWGTLSTVSFFLQYTNTGSGMTLRNTIQTSNYITAASYLHLIGVEFANAWQQMWNSEIPRHTQGHWDFSAVACFLIGCSQRAPCPEVILTTPWNCSPRIFKRKWPTIKT